MEIDLSMCEGMKQEFVIPKASRVVYLQKEREGRRNGHVWSPKADKGGYTQVKQIHHRIDSQ